MEKKPRKDDFEPIYDVENLVSSNDFTGMMPAGVSSEEAAAAYAALFAMRPAVLDADQKEEDKRKE